MNGPLDIRGQSLSKKEMFQTSFSFLAGSSLEWVPRVPGTRDILSSYVMAPVNFSEISG